MEYLPISESFSEVISIEEYVEYDSLSWPAICKIENQLDSLRGNIYDKKKLPISEVYSVVYS